MRNEKVIITLIHKVADFLTTECKENPEFAKRLGKIIDSKPSRANYNLGTEKKLSDSVPDIYLAFKTHGESEFRNWLNNQAIPTLRAIIRLHDFDPTRKTIKWQNAQKLSDFISNNFLSRLSKGSAFIRDTEMRKSNETDQQV